MLNRTIEPPITSSLDFEYKLPPCSVYTMKNQIPLYYLNEGVQEVFQFEMIFEAGLRQEPANGVAQATMALLKSGTSTKNSYQINEAIEQYGAVMRCSAGADYSSIVISGMSKHATKLLPIILEIITDTQFVQSELDIFIQNSLQRLAVQNEKADIIANRKIDEYLFGVQHPYGKYMQEEHYKALNRDLLLDFLKLNISSANCKIFLAGKYDESILKDIESLFGTQTWNSEIIQPYKEITLLPHSEKKHRIIHNESNVQGAIRLASPFPDKHHEDFYQMIVVNTLFGGYFGSRLMSNIREEKGYTYGIHSYMYNHKYESAYLITTEVGKEVIDATLSEIYKEMERMRNELVEEDELLLVKNYLLGNILGDLDGSFQIIQRWKNLILNGFDQKRFYKNIEIYKSLTAEQIRNLANVYYQPERFYELVVI